LDGRKDGWTDRDKTVYPLPSVERGYNKAKQAISLAKKKDLLSLCKSRVIPVEYHDFYKGLPANAMVNDTLPSPNAEEDEQDSDKE